MGINCNSHKLNKFFMFESLKSLCKDISYLVSHRDIVKFDITIVDAFMDEMLTDSDVFCVCVESWIDCKHQSALVVAQDSSRNFQGKSNVMEVLLNPHGFLCCVSKGHVFSLSTGEGSR